jgi:hypothetical protein
VQSISTDDLFAELRRRIASSGEPTRQYILDDVYLLAREHVANLPTGQILELGSLCEEEVDRRFKAEEDYHAGREEAPVAVS